jgi:hypothetical protein
LNKPLLARCRTTAAAAAFVFVTPVAFWLGEHHNQPFISGTEILIGFATSVVAGLLVLGRGSIVARNTFIGLALAYCFSYAAGAKEANLAFNDCVDNGEQTRLELAEYHARHGHYPASLAELGVKLPGQLIFPPHTLHYSRTSTGYKLYFKDWLMTNQATESQAFFAHK